MRPTVRVWGPFVRVGHWLLVALLVGAWLTRTGARTWHEWTGYAALAVVAARLVWGFAGSGHLRFGSFVRSPAETWAYARAVAGGREPRHIGHNPLGGYMIVAGFTPPIATGASSGSRSCIRRSRICCWCLPGCTWPA